MHSVIFHSFSLSVRRLTKLVLLFQELIVYGWKSLRAAAAAAAGRVVCDGTGERRSSPTGTIKKSGMQNTGWYFNCTSSLKYFSASTH